jgi:hypothetical protein
MPITADVEELRVLRLSDHKKARKLDRQLQRGNITHRLSANGDRHRRVVKTIPAGNSIDPQGPRIQ